MKKTVRAKAPGKSSSERHILYDEVSVNKCYGEKALTFSQVKLILGWSETPSPELPDEPCLFKCPTDGKSIWCHNVITKAYRNRFVTWPNVLALKQEHLRRRWKANGETLIIGKSGFVLNGQHQSIAFCLACLEWAANREDWDTWDEEPTMEKLVVFGINEDDDTVNSMDTAKPRSLVEVIERSEIFAAMKTADRKECAKITDHAVRLLWHRLGIKQDAFAPRRTHSEAMEFINQHPRLLECVKHIFQENGDGKLAYILTPGYSAGLMYLMATSNTGPVKYHDADTYSERNTDLSNFDKASDFFVLIAEERDELVPLRNAVIGLKRDGLDTRDARLASMIKAWCLYIQGKHVTAKGLMLDFSSANGDIRKLCECPTTGGIDRGNPRDEISTDEEPTSDEIQEHKAVEESIRAEKNGTKSVKGKKPSKKSQTVKVGDLVWVKDLEDGGEWDGEITEIYEVKGEPIGRVKSHGTGRIFETPLNRVCLMNPIV